ncbi:MAG: hypothetical protein PHY43_14445, partial [Verrucomicrobiales bacterium]|nr:hypothetical protein [Verrucomicrobiales bacterium]
ISVGAGASGDTFGLTFATQNGLGYFLEYKDALTDATWQQMTNVAGDGNPMTFDLPTAEPMMRYFRLRVQ